MIVAAIVAAFVLASQAANGGTIVFERDVGEDCEGEIWTMSADGTNQKRLIHGHDAACSPKWSPDGQRVLFSSARDGAVSIYTARADGSGIERVTSGGSDWEADWSPDATRIVFAREVAEDRLNLFDVSASGGALRRVTRGRDWDGTPDWSPDGTRILFASYSHESSSRPRRCAQCAALYLVPGRRSALARITRRETQSLMPAWSPDGAQIAWSRARTLVPERFELWIMRADARGARRLTTGEEPAWSPDGRTIAFSRDGWIWTIGVDGRGERRIARGTNPSWR